MFISLNVPNKACHICIFYYFFYLDNQIFNTTKIDKIVFAKLLIEEDDPTKKPFSIISLVIFHGFHGNQNPNIPYIKRFDHSII